MNHSYVQISTPRGTKYLSAKFPMAMLEKAASRYGWVIDQAAAKHGHIVMTEQRG